MKKAFSVIFWGEIDDSWSSLRQEFYDKGELFGEAENEICFSSMKSIESASEKMKKILCGNRLAVIGFTVIVEA